jgi:phosphoglycolate phosphatase
MRLDAIDHIIWDWNGTLLDDVWLAREVLNGQLAEMGLPLLDEERLRAQFCHPVEKFLMSIGMDFNRYSFERLAEEFHLRYMERQDECELRPSAREALQLVTAHGLPQSVLSALREDRLTEAVARNGLAGFFRAVAGVNDYLAVGKLERGVLLLRQCSEEPGRTLLIGDTDHDAEVAAALGLRCILVACGFQDERVLGRCGVPVLRSLSDLHAYWQTQPVWPGVWRRRRRSAGTAFD